ncbi:hypothetical protein BDZ90DRAFT_218716 [Jaminaea rosea]|uniref:Integral membrane protein n=1 Tax=Jaminaea rosea TaxID=1569628 RepID=A0A316USR0_9BASI|nr:hypothetical protein BDZ90DRAFT_218716 [Jaminaea rosea]PWN28336.1 hypothetical protein BDZ90DRAFT_218716 [Jaminaea rosea]
MSPPSASSPSSQVDRSAAIPLLVAGMLVTGICNSLFTKYQDQQCVANCSDPDPSKHTEFSQPVLQTAQMFVGECLCVIPPVVALARSRWGARRGKGRYTALPTSIQEEESDPVSTSNGEAATAASLWSPHAVYFALPAICDLTGTTLMNVGLILTPVSIYQMTRGALVLWVGVFSVLFLRRHLHVYQWAALCTVMLGVSVVGLSGTILRDEPREKAEGVATDQEPEVPPALAAFLGVLLILFAQLFSASQFVLEEKIMTRYNVDPLLAVSYEGLFGLTTVLLAMPLLHYFYGATPSGRGGYFDIVTGWRQMTGNSAVLWSSVAISLSIALFNGCGLAVTRALSATARSTIDTCRTLGIWIGSLLLGWEVLTWRSGPAQATGFALLVYGTLVFNGIVRPPTFLRPREGGEPLGVGTEGPAAAGAELPGSTPPVAISDATAAREAASTGVLVDAGDADRTASGRGTRG